MQIERWINGLGVEKWSFIKSFGLFKLFLMNFTVDNSIMHKLDNAKMH